MMKIVQIKRFKVFRSGVSRQVFCRQVAMLARAALRLYVAVAQFVAELPTACEQRQPSDHVAALLNEWRDVFAPDISSNLRALITHILGEQSRRYFCATLRADLIHDICLMADYIPR